MDDARSRSDDSDLRAQDKDAERAGRAERFRAEVRRRLSSGERLTASGVVRGAGVGRWWLYQHPELLSELSAAQREAAANRRRFASGVERDGVAADGPVGESTGATAGREGLDVGSVDEPAPAGDGLVADGDALGPGAEDTATDGAGDDGAGDDGTPGRVHGAGVDAPEVTEVAGSLPLVLRSVLALAHPRLREEDVDVAVAAGALAHQRARADPRPPAAAQAGSAAIGAAMACADRVGPDRLGSRGPDLVESPDWLEAAGRVVPVLGAAAGVGSSVVAAALFDALVEAGVAVLLVDAADPARSGLATVAPEGQVGRRPAEGVGVTYARRGGGWVARLTLSAQEVFSSSMVPAPSWWLPSWRSPEVTIVDVGAEMWPLAAFPGRGPGAWLQTAPGIAERDRQRPLIVCRPTRPSVAAAGQVLHRLSPWIRNQRVAAPAGWVVSGARRWPRGVSGVASQDLARLGDPVFLPHDQEVAVGGVGPAVTSVRLRRAAARLARHLDVL